MIYLLDTNAVSDVMALHRLVYQRSIERVNAGDRLAICRPIYYELLRGLLWRNASGQLRRFQQSVLPFFEWIEMEAADWEQAAHFWADARRNGRQLGDPDLLLAALVHRIDATLVSADADFDALPIRRDDWRLPQKS